MSMNKGFAIIVGKVIDMESGSFTGRGGAEVKKLSVLVKPSDEATPIECMVWGDTATNFEDASIKPSDMLILKCDVSGSEWEKNGETYRKVGITIREWETFGDDTNNELVEEAKKQFDATPF